MNLSELKALAEKATPGPYFVAIDPAEECGPHANSGLSLVETGRQSDWPIARLCEQPGADWIAAMTPERVLAMLSVIEAAKAMRTSWTKMKSLKAINAFDAALAALESNQ